MRNLLYIALGGALGSVLRYLFSLFTLRVFGQNWLFTGTAVVNILGCFLIGIVAALIQEKTSLPNAFKLLVIVGFLGGFTTFSSFGLEGYEVAAISLPKGLIYLGFQVFTGLFAVWAGLFVSKWFL